MIVSMGKAIYEVCPIALEDGRFVILRVICADITKS